MGNVFLRMYCCCLLYTIGRIILDSIAQGPCVSYTGCKGDTIVQDMIHVKYCICHIPVLQGLIKRSASPKHSHHTAYRRGIPGGQGLVKRGASTKHVVHAFDLGYIPQKQGGCIPQSATIKHVTHGSYVAGVPHMNGQTVYRRQRGKQPSHVGHICSYPGVNGTIGMWFARTIPSNGTLQNLFCSWTKHDIQTAAPYSF